MPAQHRREDGSPDSRPPPPAWEESPPPPEASVPRRQDGTSTTTTTPNFSPPATPSLNLPPLDTTSPYSPAELLQQQQSSSPPHGMDLPSSPSPLPVIRGPEANHRGSVARGDSNTNGNGGSSRDVLARRLNDLATKLHREGHHDDGGGGGGGDETLGTLSAMVDQMESIFHAQHPDARSAGAALRHLLRPNQTNGESGDAAPLKKPPPQMPGRSLSDWLGPLSPLEPSALTVNLHEEEDGDFGSQIRLDDHDDSHHHHHHHHHHSRSKMTHEQAERVVAEAQNLCREMDAVMASLKARQEESEHIHDLLITRAERAAQHIVYQERRIQELEKERDENEMEILNLQFQLKAIEVQFLGHAPGGVGGGGGRGGGQGATSADGSALTDDQELRESISAWKSEWSALKRRRARKKQRDLLAAEASSSAAASPLVAKVAGANGSSVLSSGSSPVQQRIRSHNHHSNNHNHSRSHDHDHRHTSLAVSSPVVSSKRNLAAPGNIGRPAAMTASDSRPG